MARLQPKPAGRQKGSIDLLPSGALRVRVVAGQDPITKRRHNLVEIVPAVPDAEKRASAVRDRTLRDVEERKSPRTGATISHLLEKHLELSSGAPDTLQLYRSHVKKHIDALLGRHTIAERDACFPAAPRWAVGGGESEQPATAPPSALTARRRVVTSIPASALAPGDRTSRPPGGHPMSVVDSPVHEDLASACLRREPLLSCRLRSSSSCGLPVTILSVAGEIDMCTFAAAQTALGAALDHAPGPVVVDLSGLSFCSAGGLGLLGAPAGTAAGHSYVLAGMGAHLQRAASVLWAHGHPICFPDTAAAVTALRAQRVSTPHAGVAE